MPFGFCCLPAPSELITQRSKVQILPPQPIKPIGYKLPSAFQRPSWTKTLRPTFSAIYVLAAVVSTAFKSQATLHLENLAFRHLFATLFAVFAGSAAAEPAAAAIDATRTAQPATKLVFGGFMEPRHHPGVGRDVCCRRTMDR